jgi:hypothetical protein
MVTDLMIVAKVARVVGNTRAEVMAGAATARAKEGEQPILAFNPPSSTKGCV